MRKKVLIGFLVILLAFSIYIYYLFQSGKSDLNAYSFVPKTALFVIDSEKPIKSWNTVSNSEGWKHIKGFEKLLDIADIADDLDEYVQENEQVFSLIGNRKLLISAHKTEAKDYDFLYIVDIKSSKLDFIESGIISTLEQGGYTYKSAPYLDKTVHDFYNPEDHSILHIVFQDKYLICSYSRKIINQSIQNYTTTPHFTSKQEFIQLENEISTGKLCRIFVNYEYFHEYLACYMDKVDEDLKSFMSQLNYTGLSGTLDENNYHLQGKTQVKKENNSYALAIANAGKSKFKVDEILSNKTAFFLRMGFEDFETFYNQLMESFKNKGSMESFNNNKKKLESLLKISLEEDIYSWIGDEIAIAQYEKAYLVNSKLQNVIAIKSNDIKLAKQKLKYIENQIRKRTPISFKESMYLDYPINYIEIKGLFKLLFGNLFAKVNKPYYTIIEDYIIFSDDIKSLLFTIESFEHKKTLKRDDSFSAFKESFPKNNSIFAYFSGPKYFENFSKLLDKSSWDETIKNKKYITCFEHFALSLSAKEQNLNTHLGTLFTQPKETAPTDSESSAEQKEEVISDMELFIIQNILKNVRKLYHENGTLKILAPVRNGAYHGWYYEYHENGNLKIKGKYKKGKRYGTFKLYDDDGDFESREFYRNGILVK